MEILITRGRPKGIPESPRLKIVRESEWNTYPDRGCLEATEFLGYQSACLNCPFLKCVYDLPDKRKRKDRKIDKQRQERNEEVRRLLAEGKKPKEIAEIFGISTKLVSNIKNSKEVENGS